jgi:uncharacterized protein (TIGR02147 family)
MVNLFRHNNFRIILSELVKLRKKSDPTFNFSALAQVMQVQKTYLSKVMNDKGHLNSDQIFALSEFFSLSIEEHDYIILLLECERTGLSRRRKLLQAKIASIQLEHRNPKRHLEADYIQSEMADAHAEYYLDPLMTILHMYLALPEFGGDPIRIADSLGLKHQHVKKIVLTLQRLEMISPAKKDGTYQVVKKHIRLAPESPLNSAYYSLFRLASAYQVMKTPRNLRFAYSITFSADDKTKAIIHEAYLKFLKEIDPAIKAADDREVFQMNFDLFPWR